MRKGRKVTTPLMRLRNELGGPVAIKAPDRAPEIEQAEARSENQRSNTMKRSMIFTLAATALTGLAPIAFAQEGGMKMDGMKGMEMKGMPCCEGMAHGFGVVNAVDVEARKVNLTHDPIDKIGWGKMTMDFKAGDKVDLAKFEKDDNVHFMLEKGEDGAYVVAMMCPIEGDVDAFKAAMKKRMADGTINEGMMMGDMGMKDGASAMSCMNDESDHGAHAPDDANQRR